ncbi:MAG: toll/interleukin-1 receptor domain-containing protein, partial [Candidatus Cloacimonetes bacterium]|nr:toll/interleukin-1 receptor domain-containing protein [Candidatus Cloacimonadota bacterium]
MPISQNNLIKCARQYTDLNESIVYKAEGTRLAAFTAFSTAFLCHSHHDVDLVKGLIARFAAEEIELYVDWQDKDMPETTNKVTAQKIQERIAAADYFLFLATANSKGSRWCPWEIGYADAKDKPVLIIPTIDGIGTYGNEYLQLYRRIDEGTGKQDKTLSGLSLYVPGKTTGEWLKSIVNK